ncbi:hypothetical protein SCALM49S_08893 [Streptomyces californicus]
MGVAKDGADSAVIAYFGDGASSQGDVAESFTFSAVYNAPVVFFCQNNQWAISEPTERQTRVPLYQRAQGFGFPGVRVDGNDVLACLAVTRSALERARRGEGPTLVEAFTYRMGAHTTSDDPTKYRADEERAAWEAKDPILRLRAYLEKEKFADDAFFTALDAESETLGKRVREAVRAMPDPDPMALFEHGYADGNSLVDEERAQFAAYQRIVRRLRRGGQVAMAVEKMSIAKALNESLRLALDSDPKVLIMGEDVGKLGPGCAMSPIDFDAIQASAADRPRRRRARGARLLRLRSGDRRSDHRALLLPPRSARAAGRRLPRPLPAGPAGGRVPARPRPGARRRRPLAGVLRRGS